jgi:hypothetical protein
MPRITSSGTSCSDEHAAKASSHWSSRSRISPAAFLVKVIARISCGAQAPSPSSSKARRMRDTSIQVLPAPAQASTATERRGSHAIA